MKNGLVTIREHKKILELRGQGLAGQAISKITGIKLMTIYSHIKKSGRDFSHTKHPLRTSMEVKLHVAELTRKGYTGKTICECVGLALSTIRKIQKQMGVRGLGSYNLSSNIDECFLNLNSLHHNTSKERVLSIRKLTEAGYNNKQIAYKLKCDIGTVRRWQRRLGLVGYRSRYNLPPKTIRKRVR